MASLGESGVGGARGRGACRGVLWSLYVLLCGAPPYVSRGDAGRGAGFVRDELKVPWLGLARVQERAEAVVHHGLEQFPVAGVLLPLVCSRLVGHMRCHDVHAVAARAWTQHGVERGLWLTTQKGMVVLFCDYGQKQDENGALMIAL